MTCLNVDGVECLDFYFIFFCGTGNDFTKDNRIPDIGVELFVLKKKRKKKTRLSSGSNFCTVKTPPTPKMSFSCTGNVLEAEARNWCRTSCRDLAFEALSKALCAFFFLLPCDCVARSRVLFSHFFADGPNLTCGSVEGARAATSS